MDLVAILGLAGAGVSAWWIHRYQRAHERRLRESAPRYEEDAEIAIAVGQHAAGSRDHRFVGSLGVLYGLLQDRAIIAALDADRGASRVEDAVLEALAGPEPTRAEADALAHVIGHANALARARGRGIRCVDLWAGLIRSPTDAAKLLAALEVDAVAVLTVLCHGARPPGLAAITGPVEVVLRDDDYTPQDLVCHVLEQAFSLAPDEALRRMHEVEAAGSASIGRFAAQAAQTRIDVARRLVRSQGAPLWIGFRES